ncbi:diguanylate cyclase (GGDEF)-like protein/PAS domain S-box-containing protein [Catenuloplanes nepalensis]|uniref:Diguanylate cyclase (GGDEF)-like protein/PAS domain S-box-containing protein n=1 Tax=Catenuloplanes nepalensis TaxID=587533 RepID=A0ABT9MZJ4_9ACTN|nr:bifunctional diguanylate cyclase/phosphodiesterase [Catenuloplanes nepalensis]MDP9796871.1 diguanylate cyclase (GGDEF)-like protein/PAS domain S-box-containing protein [Catenuloplanes nepalensis]
MSAGRVSVGFTVWLAVLTALFYAFPQQKALTWVLIGLSGAAAVLAGVRLHRPRRRLPWYLLAAALVALNIGDTYYNWLVEVAHDPDPFPSYADAVYVVVPVLLAAALLRFMAARTVGRDRNALLEALMVTAALALLAWVYLVAPFIRDSGVTVVERVAAITGPVGDLVCVAALARLLATGGRRPVSANLLVLGVLSLLVTDCLYSIGLLSGDWRVGGPVDLGWVIFYGAPGLAALQPSMRWLTEPMPRLPGYASRANAFQGTMLLAVSLVGPVVLLAEAMRGNLRDVPLIACVTLLISMLGVLWSTGSRTRFVATLDRESALREAGARLVSATTVAAVGDVVRSTVVRLLPADAPHAVLFAPAVADHDEAGEVGDLDREVSPPGRRPWLAAGRELIGFDRMLCCPLGVEPVQTLYLGAAEEQLRLLAGSMEVLASQTGLAMARIALTEEVHRAQSEAYFRTLILHASDVIMIVDSDDTVRYASPSAHTVLEAPDLVGAALETVIDLADRTRFRHMLAQARAGVGRHDGMDFTAVRRDGARLQIEVNCRDMRDEPTVNGLVLTLRDVTERRTLERELTHQALHDSLTGLANRVLFTDRAQHAAARAGRDGSLVGVLLIDLNGFRLINEALGHTVGDRLLAGVAERLTEVLRPGDTVARLGADEFAALIEDVSHLSELEEIAGRVTTALTSPFTIEGEQIGGVASVGVSTTAEARDADELLRQADLALNVAKAAGRGQWRRYQAEVHSALVARLELRAALEQAVSGGHFVLQYQPIVDLLTDEAAGFEALVRWKHPTRGVIPPDQFINLAEETGLIVPIGNWVLEEALRSAERWNRLVPSDRPRYVSVNVSARQFRHPGFMDSVRQILADSGVPPRALLLEITESLLLRDDEQVWADLAALRQTGVRIAIDDFGTGYSSLSYLRHMPIDVLKIDKSFIDDMVHSRKQRALVSAIVQLADTLDLRVIAEGIEEPVHREMLASMGCPYGQGYLFSRPVNAADIYGWLSARGKAPKTATA